MVPGQRRGRVALWSALLAGALAAAALLLADLLGAPQWLTPVVVGACVLAVTGVDVGERAVRRFDRR